MIVLLGFGIPSLVISSSVMVVFVDFVVLLLVVPVVNVSPRVSTFKMLLVSMLDESMVLLDEESMISVYVITTPVVVVS